MALVSGGGPSASPARAQLSGNPEVPISRSYALPTRLTSSRRWPKSEPLGCNGALVRGPRFAARDLGRTSSFDGIRHAPEHCCTLGWVSKALQLPNTESASILLCVLFRRFPAQLPRGALQAFSTQVEVDELRIFVYQPLAAEPLLPLDDLTV